MVRGAVLLAGISFCFVGARWLARWVGGGLQVRALDCEIRHEDKSCEVSPEVAEDGMRSLRLWVESAQPCHLRVFDGFHALAPSPENILDDGKVVEVRVRPGTDWRRLTVLCRSGSTLRMSGFRLGPLQDLGWIAEARRAWTVKSNAEEAARILKAHENEAIPDDQQARAMSLRAGLAFGRNDWKEAAAAFERAIRLARDTGQLTLALDDTLWLTRMWVEQQRLYDTAHRRWADMNHLLALAPEKRLWQEVQLVEEAIDRGQGPASLPQLHDAIREATRFEDVEVLSELLLRRGEILFGLGRTKEGVKEIDRVQDVKLEGCRVPYVQQDRGEQRLLALQAALVGGAKPGDFPDLDPRSFLQDARALFQARCDDQKEAISRTSTDLALSALLFGDPALARAELREAKRVLVNPTDALRAEWLDIEGQLLLLEAAYDKAETVFQDLLLRARSIEDEPVALERTWRAQLGLAETYWRQGRIPKARAAFEEAETALDARGLFVPYGHGRDGFYGRHERGTALLVEFLLEQGDFDGAFNAIRHARTRGIQARAQVVRWTDEERDRVLDAIRKYKEEREKLESERCTALETPSEKDILECLRRRELRIQRLLDEAARSLLARRWADLFIAPPAEGEVLLACHPIRAGAVCLAALAGSPTAWARLARLDEASLRGALAPDQSTEFAKRLRAADRVRVLGYGGMRRFDIDSLLGRDGRVRVSFGFDARSKRLPRMLIAASEAGGLGESRSLVERITEIVQSDWQVSQFVSGIRIRGQFEGRRGSTFRLDATRLRQYLDGIDLFFIYAHGRVEANTRAIETVDGDGILVSDVLLLDKAPPFVVLIACGAGRSTEEIAGLEGIGLPQAFLDRGSRWVIAATDDVRREVGQAMSTALFEAGLRTPEADPVKVLRDARKLVRERLKNAKDIDAQLGLFQVFEP